MDRVMEDIKHFLRKYEEEGHKGFDVDSVFVDRFMSESDLFCTLFVHLAKLEKRVEELEGRTM